MSTVWSNWSGWVKAWPKEILTPESEDALARIVGEAAGPVRVAGRGHSFTAIVPSDDVLLSLEKMSGVTAHDANAQTARIAAGTTIRDLGPMLHDKGLALANQGDIDRQALAGAVGTGTHGTGGKLGSLSAAVQGFRLVTASGEVLDCNRNENADVYDAGRVSFGSLGVMSEIEMQLRPSYALEEGGGRMALSEALAKAPEMRDANRHFEFFWFPFADDVLVKTLNETDQPAKPRRRAPDGEISRGDRIMQRACDVARFAPPLRGPIQRFMTRNAGERYAPGQAGKARWSFDAFPSDRNVRFNEMEYAVPAESGPDCIAEVGEYMKKCGVNFLFPLEFRYVAADDAWLSPFHERDSVTISVHQYHRQPYAELFKGAEAIFARYQGRPHWGKLHTLGEAELRNLYPRWEDFQQVRRRLDPNGKFLNPHLRRLFGENA